MAQNVKIPRFWVNELEFYSYNGNTYNVAPMLANVEFKTLPVSQNFMNGDRFFNFSYDLENPFCAVLGHSNLASNVDVTEYGIGGEDQVFQGDNETGQVIQFARKIEIYDDSLVDLIDSDDDKISINADAEVDGWSIMELTGTPSKFHVHGDVGSVIIGSYWDAPRSPDLNVVLSYDYSGIKTITGKGGHTFSNSLYHKNPKWGNLSSWELFHQDSGSQNLAKSGRRSWDISFSFLSESNIFPASLNLAKEAAQDDDQATVDTLNTGGDDFYSQVLNKTAGGSIPFLFSPDSTSNALDNFAICTIPQNSFSFRQVSPTLYSCKLKVVETW